MAAKTKFFRVATEGATTDGRTIQRDWITQMAKNFNRATYGARVWMEHYRGIMPDGPFKAYGDVTAVEAREVDTANGKRLALFAQIDPLPDLVAMVNKGQKIYTSIEVSPKFADTGEAYLTGLAVTDTPASLGTEILAFCAQKPDASPFKGRKSHADALFSEAVEAAIEFEPDATDDGTSVLAKFTATVQAAVDKLKGLNSAGTAGNAGNADARFTQLADGLQSIAGAVSDHAKTAVERHSALAREHAQLKGDHDKLRGEFTALTAKLSQQRSDPARPPATGSSGTVQTDC